MVLSARAGVIMLSPSTFLANTLEPAPIKVIFGIGYFLLVVPFFHRNYNRLMLDGQVYIVAI